MILFRAENAGGLDARQVAEFVASPRTISVRDGGVFEFKVAILGVQVDDTVPDAVNLSVLLRSDGEIPPQVFLAVHLNDATGKVIGSPGDRLLQESGLGIPAGRSWVATYTVKKEMFTQAASIGLAVYVTADSLFKVSGGQTDWDGRRLILPTRG
jgi:hypothetical protein